MNIEYIKSYWYPHGASIMSAIYCVIILIVIHVFIAIKFKKQNRILSIAIILMSWGFVIDSTAFDFISGFKYVIDGADDAAVKLLDKSREISSNFSFIGIGLLAYYLISFSKNNSTSKTNQSHSTNLKSEETQTIKTPLTP